MMSMSAWILVIVTFERVIVIGTPYKAKLICTRKNMCIALLCICVCLCLVYITMLKGQKSTYDVIFIDDVHFIINAYCVTEIKITYWIDSIFRCICPSLLMLIGNIVIITLLTKASQSRNVLSTSANVETDRNQLRSITILLLTTTFTYLLLTFPYIIYILSAKYLRKFYSSNDAYISAMHLWYMSNLCLGYINNSINFLLYCIGGTRFREEFIDMLNCRKSKETVNKLGRKTTSITVSRY